MKTMEKRMQKFGIVTRNFVTSILFFSRVGTTAEAPMAKIVGFASKGKFGEENMQAIGPSRPI